MTIRPRFALPLALAGWLVLAGACPPAGNWIDPGTGAVMPSQDVLAAMARRPVVLLGETHDDAEHHRWQLHTLAALHAHRPDMAIGFEMFPRRVQPVLDRWVAGELDEQAFLDAVDWETVWGFDPDLYLPLFHFARQYRVPMIALNVDRDLVARVRREGWDAVPADAREGVGDPAPAGEAYRAWLAKVWEAHRGGDAEDEAGFENFVAAQLTWDRAMAEALAEARTGGDAPLVVGILGAGHVAHGHGVPFQLADLGVAEAGVLLPWTRRDDCADLTAGVADAAFMVADRRGQGPPPPRLGVQIGPADDGVAVAGVVADSIAETAGLRAGDIIVRAAGRPLNQPGDLIAIVTRQAPGTWLPLAVRRDDELREVIARFPADEPTP